MHSERGFFMIEQAHRVIDQLQDDPDLVGMTRSPTDDPDESRVGPSSPEIKEIDEIEGLDNLEVTMPHAGSLGDVSIQPEIVRTSGRASAPNPLRELINIYDDEESEVSLVTPVHITKEKERHQLPMLKFEVFHTMLKVSYCATRCIGDGYDARIERTKRRSFTVESRHLNDRLSSKYQAYPQTLQFQPVLNLPMRNNQRSDL
jgi:hypothetical protein